MNSTSLSDFVNQATAAGVPHQTLIGMLTAQGWTEKEIYRALAENYRATIGFEVPVKSSSTASAKDAFFYLLTFSTLATWTINFGYLAFTLIDRWLRDPLFTRDNPFWSSSETASHIAAIVIAYPLYLLISRSVILDTATYPEKLESGVRKWLTYLALVIAAGVLMCDLITALEYLLRGEITSRFLAKVVVVLALSGGTFFYYFLGLRGTAQSLGGRSRNRVMAAVSGVAVTLVLVFGFLNLGAPHIQREIRADQQRLQGIYRLSIGVQAYWTSNAKELPSDMSQVQSEGVVDPITRAAYQYRADQGSKYELCAIFQTASPDSDDQGRLDPWKHPAGSYCFKLDAAVPTLFPYATNP